MKAISLFSGGLDSQLAVCVIKEQGIEVEGINFVTPFFGAEERTRQAARDLNIEFHFMDIGPDYMDVLKKPVYGYGKNMNPCIDCHAYMFKKAGEYMREIGADFLISGEVIGQRPMSQNKSALNAVEKLSGNRGLIVRPLSGQILPATIPETEGWLDRSKLLSISGRSRHEQMRLAEHYGIIDYPTPAGGCLLTQESFSKRLRKLFALRPAADAVACEILKVGRHFYLADDQLLVVGRNHAENERLQELANAQDYLFKVTDRPGPLGLLRLLNTDQAAELVLAARIVARYSDARTEESTQVKISQSAGSEETILQVVPLPIDQVPPTI